VMQKFVYFLTICNIL